jgi:hypothetical protein
MRRLFAGFVLSSLALMGVGPTAEAATTRPQPPPIRLRCAAVHPPTVDKVVVGCKWTQSAHPRFYAYKLLRIGGGVPGRTTVFRTTNVAATAARDRTVRPDHRYAYGVVVYGPNMQVLQTSNVVIVHT